ncbi:condensation domain-containing protein [Gordonia sp. NPDC003504]
MGFTRRDHAIRDRCRSARDPGATCPLGPRRAVVGPAGSIRGDPRRTHRPADVHVATANANRPHPVLDGVVGNFAEDLPMRLDVDDAMPMVDLMREVARQLAGGLAHPDISVPDLIDEWGLRRAPAGPSGDPLFAATLILQQAELGQTDTAAIDLGGILVAREPADNTVAKHDLEFTLVELRDGDRPADITGTLLYPLARHYDATAAAVVDGLLTILRAVAASGVDDLRVDDLRELLR